MTTLFTAHPDEYGTTIELVKLNNQKTTKKLPQIPKITLDPKLTFFQLINLTIIKAKQTLNILKALTFTKYGKQKN